MRDWLESDVLLTIPAPIILAIACRAKRGTEPGNGSALDGYGLMAEDNNEPRPPQGREGRGPRKEGKHALIVVQPGENQVRGRSKTP